MAQDRFIRCLKSQRLDKPALLALPLPIPHNQTFAVAIELGLVGVAVLWAMWIAHLFLFRGNGLAGWMGLVIVRRTSSVRSLTRICSISCRAGFTSSALA